MNITAQREIIGIGHNAAPLKDMLAVSYADLLKEIDEAAAAAGRAPATIESDEISGKVADLVSDIRKLKKAAEAGHDAEKAPFLSAGRDVDDFFRGPCANADGAIKGLLAKQAVYLDAKDRLAREEARKAEEAARSAADEKLREAERAQNEGNFDGADSLLAAATIAEEVAETASLTLAAKPADLTRIHSRGGSVTSLRREWTFAVENRDVIDLEAIRPYLAPADVDKAIRGFVKAGKRELKGVRIFEQAKAR